MKIILYPDKILSRVADLVRPDEMDKIGAVIEAMIIALRMNRGVGLAAPQIGINKRIIIWTNLDRKELVAINPTITRSRGKFKMMENCLSLPNISRVVKRKRVLEVDALDENGKRYSNKFANTDAAIVQHEIDHLNGITILDGTKKRRRAERKWNESTKLK